MGGKTDRRYELQNQAESNREFRMGLENISCNYNGTLEMLGVDFISCDLVL